MKGAVQTLTINRTLSIRLVLARSHVTGRATSGSRQYTRRAVVHDSLYIALLLRHVLGTQEFILDRHLVGGAVAMVTVMKLLIG